MGICGGDVVNVCMVVVLRLGADKVGDARRGLVVLRCR